MKTFITTIALLFALSVFTVVIVRGVKQTQNCTGYLKRAADANTVEIAKSQLDKAILYLEEHELTTGYTSILYKTPDEDVEFWFNNLKASQSELAKVNETTSSLEKTNLLMKLRETLIDNSGDAGDTLTIPNGLSRYPHNGFFAVLMWISSLALIGLFVWWIVDSDL